MEIVTVESAQNDGKRKEMQMINQLDIKDLKERKDCSINEFH